MRLHISLGGVVLMLIVTAAAGAQTYDIKFKSRSDIGKTVTVQSSEKETGSMKGIDADGKVVFEKRATNLELLYTRTVLARDGTKTTKSKRTYQKAVEGEADKPRTLSYQGRTLLYEFVDGQYRIGVAGKP